MRTFIVLLSVFSLMSCKSSEKQNYGKLSDNTFAQNTKDTDQHPGKKLLESNCYVCHSPTASHDKRIAPPMIAVKKHYISSKTTKESFKKEMQEWIENPTKEKSKMFGAVKRFGLMPKTPFSKETIDQIADYMFDNEIEQPKWFKEHSKSMKKNE